ncbi:UPF0102 protein [Alphaproteobacteria bacterium]|nr:UPF0102 protein [Alphaproteobacteria bacterium]GHS96755.1 UPF0102 protein [Alphaproteobacteria bacterium]
MVAALKYSPCPAQTKESFPRAANTSVPTSYQKGVDAEKHVAFFLERHGYDVLCKRYKTSVGEIDIVAFKDNILHIVEVKNRKLLHQARVAISEKQKARLAQAAELFLAESAQNLAIEGVQMDAVFVAGTTIYHLERAWDPVDSF